METTFNQTPVSRFCESALHKKYYYFKWHRKLKSRKQESNKNEAKLKKYDSIF